MANNTLMTSYVSADDSGISQEVFILVGIIVNIIISLMTCGERIFSRVGSSTCIKGDTSIDIKTEGAIRASNEKV